MWPWGPLCKELPPPAPLPPLQHSSFVLFKIPNRLVLWRTLQLNWLPTPLKLRRLRDYEIIRMNSIICWFPNNYLLLSISDPEFIPHHSDLTWWNASIRPNYDIWWGYSCCLNVGGMLWNWIQIYLGGEPNKYWRGDGEMRLRSEGRT